MNQSASRKWTRVRSIMKAKRIRSGLSGRMSSYRGTSSYILILYEQFPSRAAPIVI